MKMAHEIIKLSALAVTLAACGSTQAPPPPKPVAAAPKQVQMSPAEQVEAANRDFAKGDYAAAIKGYERVLSKEPTNSAARFNRAVALQKAGDLAAAKEAYAEVLKDSPNDTAAALNLGVILKEMGDLDSAVKIYKKALESDEFNPDLLNNLSALYRHQKKYRKAIRSVRKLLMRDKDNIDAYKNLALVYFEQKKYKLTQTILENALKMSKAQDKQDPDIYVNLGMLHLALEQNGKAMAAFKKAIEIEPNHVIANYNIGALALGHRDYNLAMKAYEVVTKAWQNDYEAAASLGYALQGLQRHEDAAKQLERAREIKLNSAVAQAATGSEDEEILLQLMIIWQNAENADKALVYADEYMKLKNIQCGPQDFEGFCGRYTGLKMMKEMAQQAAPAPEAATPQGGKVDVFTDGDEASAEGEAPVEGAPAEGDPALEGGEASATP